MLNFLMTLGAVVSPICVMPLTEDNIETVLNDVRPGLMDDGRNVVLHEIDGLVVVLKLQEACGWCPSSTMTLKMVTVDVPDIRGRTEILKVHAGNKKFDSDELWSLMGFSGQSADVIMRMMARNSMSEKLAEDIDAAVKRISDSAYEIVLRQVRNNREAMDKIVEVLLEKETMSGDEFRAMLSEFVEIPAENLFSRSPNKFQLHSPN
ncbi:ATP-dependent zinc metalloprotease FTSH 2, chloroplastic [Olea europaea subsp. europaea]|uniref:ATP-dependent zinc metalloprotease FTSH 2, chloroplastic n=1 Tax=Olea europaea subsp. europaea TaxID=158383 RepID=A0A8S0P653_OLEEU|nr:ATP-dependent zinc metalloprotease FTSH 2, chloroplastic [Olea europaea subsp. europaea]